MHVYLRIVIRDQLESQDLTRQYLDPKNKTKQDRLSELACYVGYTVGGPKTFPSSRKIIFIVIMWYWLQCY